MRGYAIDSDTSGVKIKELWDDNGTGDARRVSSKYVVYVEGRTLFARDVHEDDPDNEVQYDFWPDTLELSEYFIDVNDIILADRHVFAFFSYWKEGVKKDIQGCNYKESVLVIDLEANEAYHQKHAFGNYASVDESEVPRFPPKTTLNVMNWKNGSSTDVRARISWGDHNKKIDK